MKTVFDIATEEELLALFDDPERVKRFAILTAQDADVNLSCLAMLFKRRGDEKAANYYAMQVRDHNDRIKTFEIIKTIIKTIFDIATEEELLALFGNPKKVEEFAALTLRSADVNLACFAMLFKLRGDEKSANYYAMHIQDHTARVNTFELIETVQQADEIDICQLPMYQLSTLKVQ